MAELLFDPKFDLCRRLIEVARQKGAEWDTLPPAGMDPQQFDEWLLMQQQYSYWPSLGNSAIERRQRWADIVSAKRAAEEASISASRPLVVIGKEETEPGIVAPQASHSMWQLYKARLISQQWNESAIDSVESSALRILKHMRRSTLGRKPVKGLVVGHVQSGKTASMAGLIAMAADHRWNLVIVLTGTLDNLRIQTRNRLHDDLNHHGNLQLKVIDHPSRGSPRSQRAQDMHFQSDSPGRHLIVCLKNSSRLKSLIDWIKADAKSMNQMKILIIDDEADQAGINTADISADERSQINRQIIALISVPALSVNYVAYTATPAANFLNEGPGGSLYPEDFIVCLRQSDEHFGPLQLFGIPEQGYNPLGIVREISKDDLEDVRALHGDTAAGLPATLIDSLMWFLCCVAVMRVDNFAKPVSMLIHTSQRQAHHENVGQAVRSYLSEQHADIPGFLTRCKEVWEKITTDLNDVQFAERFPLYGRLAELGANPSFDLISEMLPEVVSEISAIRLDETKAMTFHRGVHVCIDNCANNRTSGETEVRRLFYPAPDMQNPPKFASAFIVIGGSTLARGLTIENLVSTYFLRASAQADSLMQMGRWFGYRRGYELLPRIWMPEETRFKFEFITLAEEDLRDDLQRFMYAGVKPAEVGPRVRVHPRASWLRPTGKNKMQEAMSCEYDFSGVSRQTTVFHDGPAHTVLHTENRALTESFLSSLKESRAAERGVARVWDAVPLASVSNFLTSFSFNPNAQFFSEMPAFLEWTDKVASGENLTHWNVVVSGNRPDGEDVWTLPDGSQIGLINRSRVPSRSVAGKSVSVGVLRTPTDLLADARLGKAKLPRQLGNEAIANWRTSGGVGQVPQLLLYLINKDSEPKHQFDADDGDARDSLAAGAHIVGVSIWLPGSGNKVRSYVSHLTVRIPTVLDSDSDDLENTFAEENT